MKRRTLLFSPIALLTARHIPAFAQSPVATPAGYAHPDWLADPAWLDQHLHDENLIVIALTPPGDFEKGHIDGAVQVDWPDLALSESSQIDAWRTQMEKLLTNLGVERADTVVIYDGGTLYAPRLWWILYQLGQPDIRILNGGLPAWTAAALPLTEGASSLTAASAPYTGEPNDDAIATVDQVVAALDDPNTILVDARTKDEYDQGHIPGAVLFPFTDVATAASPHVWKSAPDLQSAFAALDVTPDKHVIAYCSTGVRSAALYFTLRLIGYPDVSLFSGSYDEWTTDPSRPVETS
jgi:thiosulfate/3-mercaptopyruvate sulfurtransferase